MSSPFTTLLDDARAAGRGVGAFNVVLLEHAEAIVAGAAGAGLPVVLQISENCVTYHRGLVPITVAAQAVARAADVEVLVHLDHVKDLDLVATGIELGVDSIMFDGSELPYEENLAATRDVARRCHDAGIGVEAELGEVGGKDGVHVPGARTDPADAAEFVAATGVDALAVAVGTSHAMRTRVASADRELIRELARSVPVPLVLHGSSGLSDAELRGAVGAGMTKVNVATHLNGLFTGALRQVLTAQPDVTDPRRYVSAGRAAVEEETIRLLRVLAEGTA
ncbi:class II fructose-bisphosphate aldolase [Kineococcus sp. SYSU DK002]|uniref:class II fructose-bisphosphate aldolase n=1 Tax=Kineococcus sp. SYSU DK002 TaxID=3383123 RepID=UPI003D7D089B